MRSTFAGLNTMYKGIIANQLSLDTVGHNITNADTDGYSRQKVNQAATMAQEYSTAYGYVMVGTGSDALSLTRARNVYADKQYWKENATQSYYQTRQTNYDKVEAIFNDTSESGIQNAMEAFYKSWVDLSANASTTSNRMTVIEQAKVFIDRISTANTQLQDQINADYTDLSMNIDKLNDLADQIADLNRNIASIEATGTHANDLRDKRDLLTDEFSSYLNVSVYEDTQTGMYQLVTNGVSLVSGLAALHLELGGDVPNKTYGITDHSIMIKETDTLFVPADGILKAKVDSIAEDKTYMDKLSNMAAFMLTEFNDQHRAGYGLIGNMTDPAKTEINFFGDKTIHYTWDDTKKVVNTGSGELSGVEIIKALAVNTQLTDPNGTEYVCAAGGKEISRASDTRDAISTDVEGTFVSVLPNGNAEKKIVSIDTTATPPQTTTVTVEIEPNGSADGSNAVLVSTLFNEGVDSGSRSIGLISLEAYYNAAMSELGAASEAMDNMVDAQAIIITQVDTWRSSTAGVNWNEELTNMIMFQQGYNACSRCLTTMDEMLDRLINNTGVVGR